MPCLTWQFWSPTLSEGEGLNRVNMQTHTTRSAVELILLVDSSNWLIHPCGMSHFRLVGPEFFVCTHRPQFTYLTPLTVRYEGVCRAGGWQTRFIASPSARPMVMPRHLVVVRRSRVGGWSLEDEVPRMVGKLGGWEEEHLCLQCGLRQMGCSYPEHRNCQWTSQWPSWTVEDPQAHLHIRSHLPSFTFHWHSLTCHLHLAKLVGAHLFVGHCRGGGSGKGKMLQGEYK